VHQDVPHPDDRLSGNGRVQGSHGGRKLRRGLAEDGELPDHRVLDQAVGQEGLLSERPVLLDANLTYKTSRLQSLLDNVSSERPDARGDRGNA
jgi:hypothetical protein